MNISSTFYQLTIIWVNNFLRFCFYVLAAQEGRKGLVQTAPENPKEERGRIRRQSQKEGSLSES